MHFHKSFGVMQEIFDHRDFTTFGTEIYESAQNGTMQGMLPQVRFLDLGCAPGGFSGCLLQDSLFGSNSVSYGVTLPPHLGGFHMAFASDRFSTQFEDILALQTTDLVCADNSIDMCIADAQYLSNLFKKKDLKNQYRGTRVKSQQLGIWALTVKECQLAFAKLRTGGGFVFRFGWRGVDKDFHPSGEQVPAALLAKYLQEEEWYKALTHWLFSVLKSLFTTLRPFKSEYVHQADVSFYMVCRGFDRQKYESFNWEEKLRRAFESLCNCEDEGALATTIQGVVCEDTKAEINELLELVGRMRAIGINSRKVTNPKAFVKWDGWKEVKKDNDAANASTAASSEASAAAEPPKAPEVEPPSENNVVNPESCIDEKPGSADVPQKEQSSEKGNGKAGDVGGDVDLSNGKGRGGRAAAVRSKGVLEGGLMPEPVGRIKDKGKGKNGRGRGFEMVGGEEADLRQDRLAAKGRTIAKESMPENSNGIPGIARPKEREPGRGKGPGEAPAPLSEIAVPPAAAAAPTNQLAAKGGRAVERGTKGGKRGTPSRDGAVELSDLCGTSVGGGSAGSDFARPPPPPPPPPPRGSDAESWQSTFDLVTRPQREAPRDPGAPALRVLSYNPLCQRLFTLIDGKIQPTDCDQLQQLEVEQAFMREMQMMSFQQQQFQDQQQFEDYRLQYQQLDDGSMEMQGDQPFQDMAAYHPTMHPGFAVDQGAEMMGVAQQLAWTTSGTDMEGYTWAPTQQQQQQPYMELSSIIPGNATGMVDEAMWGPQQQALWSVPPPSMVQGLDLSGLPATVSAQQDFGAVPLAFSAASPSASPSAPSSSAPAPGTAAAAKSASRTPFEDRRPRNNRNNAAETRRRSRDRDEDSSDESSDEDGRKGGRKDAYRHKRRAGRLVRERRHGRRRHEAGGGSMVASMTQTLRYVRSGRFLSGVEMVQWSTVKELALDIAWEVRQGEFMLHVMRFGLFLAMAWSMNSIIFSVVRLYNGEI